MKGTSVLSRCSHCDGFLRPYCSNCSNTGQVTDWRASPPPIAFWAFGGPLIAPWREVLKPCPICLGTPWLAERTICHGCNGKVEPTQKQVLLERANA